MKPYIYLGVELLEAEIPRLKGEDREKAQALLSERLWRRMCNLFSHKGE